MVGEAWVSACLGRVLVPAYRLIGRGIASCGGGAAATALQGCLKQLHTSTLSSLDRDVSDLRLVC